MILIFVMILAILTGLFVPRFLKDITKMRRNGDGELVSLGWARYLIRGASIVVVIICICSTSMVNIYSDKVGHLKKIYGGNQMESGRIIALPNELGPQARVLMPGFQFELFIRIIYDIEELDVFEVHNGNYGFVTSKDGKPMPEGQFLAPAWDDTEQMMNALVFMGYPEVGEYKGPRGVKGPQLTVLKPGFYRFNRYLYDVTEEKATDVPIGNVAVIKSNVGEHYTGKPLLPSGVESTTLSVPIVPKGYKGVWNEVLKPDRYYLNLQAYTPTIIPTQIQTWKYIGGYERRYIDLELTDDGKINQSVRKEQIPVPENAADCSVLLRVENWDVFQDARIQIQVTPENAPFVVAAAGGLTQIEDKIMTPTFRSVLRNEAAKNVEDTREIWNSEKNKMEIEHFMRPRKVLDLLYKREGLEQTVENKLIPEGAKYGLTVMEVRFGDPSVPPELLVPGKRKQLAESLISTYQQEKLAQTERVNSEKERARADQQGTLMKSEIGITVAKNDATARAERGLGEEKYMKSVASGQEAQASVLGKDKAFELAYIKEVLSAARENPDLIKYPNILVMGSDNSLNGPAAILGASNLNMGLGRTLNKKDE
jgi:hypothetical protein